MNEGEKKNRQFLSSLLCRKTMGLWANASIVSKVITSGPEREARQTGVAELTKVRKIKPKFHKSTL